jgi:hypothetical protein
LILVLEVGEMRVDVVLPEQVDYTTDQKENKINLEM